MEHRSSTVVLHWFLSWACRSSWVHCRPFCLSSCSADLPQLFFGNHGFVYLGDSKKVPVWLRCYVVSLAYGQSTSTSFFRFGLSWSSSCPEKRIVWPDAKGNLLDLIHLVSLIPRRLILYLLISFAICWALPASNMVLTFHVPSLVVVLGVSKRFGPSALTLWVWP